MGKDALLVAITGLNEKRKMKTCINNRASAGSGETKCGAGGSRSKLRKNPGFQPGGAGARGGRGTTDH